MRVTTPCSVCVCIAASMWHWLNLHVVSQRPRRNERHKIPLRLSQDKFGWRAEAWHKLCRICKRALASRIRRHSSGSTKCWGSRRTKSRRESPTAQREIPGSMTDPLQRSRSKKSGTRLKLKYSKKHMIGYSPNRRKNGRSSRTNLVRPTVESAGQTYTSAVRNIAARNELRPGDHYNVLLGFPGFLFYS